MKGLRIAGNLLALICLVSASLAESGEKPVPKFRDVSVHDPSVIRAEDGTYYIFGSHMAAAKSTDLMQWQISPGMPAAAARWWKTCRSR